MLATARVSINRMAYGEPLEVPGAAGGGGSAYAGGISMTSALPRPRPTPPPSAAALAQVGHAEAQRCFPDQLSI